MESKRPRPWTVSLLFQIALLVGIYLAAPQVMEGPVPWIEAAFFYFFTGIAFWDLIPGSPLGELFFHVSLFIAAIVVFVRAGRGRDGLKNLIGFNLLALAWTLFPLVAILAGDYRGP